MPALRDKPQQQLFELPLDESRLGPMKRGVLARIDRFGKIGARGAGRLVYRNRGQNPERIEKDWLKSAGLRVLISLRRHGLVFCGRDDLWRRRRQCTRMGY